MSVYMSVGNEGKVLPLRIPSRRDGLKTSPDSTTTIQDEIGRQLDSLYATGLLLTKGDTAAAEDLVQETAICAFRAWGNLRAPQAAKAWLLRILYRTFLTTERRESSRPPLVDIDIDELVQQAIPAIGAGLLTDGLLTDEVASALGELPSGFCEAVWLVDVEELTLAEAAEVFGLPLGTVASRVHRARRMLRERLQSTRAPRKGGR